MSPTQPVPGKRLLIWAAIGLIIIGLTYAFCPEEPATTNSSEHSTQDNPPPAKTNPMK